MTQHKCPEINDLRSFVCCSLSEAELEAINDHLGICRVCEETVVWLEKNSDTIAERIRLSPPIPFVDEPECQQLLAAVPHGELTTGRLSGEESACLRPPFAVRDYRLLELLGQGGMGQVHRAIHQRLKRTVAVKLLSSARLRDHAAIARFEREMAVLGRLDHPHIVRAQDAGEHDGRHYLVMEYVDGIDLAELVRRNGRLPIAEACLLIRQAAIGLQYAHERGCVHRDIKPSNLMLARADGGAIVKILDLGLARALEDNGDCTQLDAELTVANQVMGTPDYMAPEQGDDSHVVDIRADVYSLGATFYKLLTGEIPHAAHACKPPLQRLMAMAQNDPPQIRSKRAEVPIPLANIVHRMLARDPNKRFSTPAEVATALEPFCVSANADRLLSPCVDTATEAGGVKSEQRPRRDSSSTRRRPYGLMFWGGTAILVLGIILQMATRHGTIIVDCPDGDLPSDVQLVISDSGEQVALLQASNSWTAKIVNGVFEVEVRQGSDRIQLETHQITLSRLGQTVVKVRLQPSVPSTSDTRPVERVISTPDDDAASPVVFAVLRDQLEPRVFPDLTAALEILRPNDIVEIRGHGQIDIRIRESVLFPLVLRAAKGHRPTLVFDELPLRGFGQDLTIEGCYLDVRKNLPHLPRVNAITLRRCGVWGYLHNLAGKHILVEDSILVPVGGFAAGNVSGVSSDSVVIELRHTAIRCLESLLAVRNGNHTLKLVDCTVFAEDQAAPTLVSFGQDASAHVDIEATGCLFHCRSQTNGIICHEFLPQVTWRGRENCYSGDFYTAWEQDASGQYLKIREKGLAAWNKLWPEPEIDSREVELVRFHWGDIWRTSRTNRKDAIRGFLNRMLSGRMNRRTGPDWSIIGAGDAFATSIRQAGLNRDRLPHPHADGPIVILRQDQVVAGFPSLVAAVDAALDHDVIEIRRSGAVAGCDITGENRLLTIRGGAGYEPSISDVSLRNIGSDQLVLEGLRFDHPVHGSGGGSPANWNGTDPTTALFPGHGAIRRVQNCWVKSVLTGWMDSSVGQTPEIVNCEIDRIEVGIRSGQRAAIRNSVCQTVVVNTDSATSSPAILEMNRSVVWAPLPNRNPVAGVLIAPTPMHFRVSDCVFIAPEVLVFHSQPQWKWTGNRNVYQASQGSNREPVLDSLRAPEAPEDDSCEPIPFEFSPEAWTVLTDVSPGYEKRSNGNDYGINVEQLSRKLDAWFTPAEQSIPGAADIQSPAVTGTEREIQAQRQDIARSRIRELGGQVLESEGRVHAVELGNTAVTDADLALITAFPTVEGVMLQNTNVTIVGIRQLPLGIMRLDLGGTRLSDHDTLELLKRSSLQDLSLEGGPFQDDAVITLCRLPGLRTLSLQETAVTDRSLSAIATCQKLEVLVLNSCRKLTAPAMADLHQLPRLRELHLANTAIDDRAIGQLISRVPLVMLGLTDCVSITDLGLQSIATSETLEVLFLDGTTVTQAGLAQLKSMPRLRSIYLRKNPDIDVEVLRSQLPGRVRIVDSW